MQLDFNLSSCRARTDGFEQSELLSPKEALEHAGATVHAGSPKDATVKAWDESDRNLTTSRNAQDLPAFNKAIVEQLARASRMRRRLSAGWIVEGQHSTFRYPNPSFQAKREIALERFLTSFGMTGGRALPCRAAAAMPGLVR